MESELESEFIFFRPESELKSLEVRRLRRLAHNDNIFGGKTLLVQT